MKRLWHRLWREEDGVLSFEWVLLTTLVVLGIVAGLTAARDAVIDELGDAAQGMLALDNSYTIDWPLEVTVDLNVDDATPGEVVGLAAESSFTDGLSFTDCARGALAGQATALDSDS